METRSRTRLFSFPVRYFHHLTISSSISSSTESIFFFLFTFAYSVIGYGTTQLFPIQNCSVFELFKNKIWVPPKFQKLLTKLRDTSFSWSLIGDSCEGSLWKDSASCRFQRHRDTEKTNVELERKVFFSTLAKEILLPTRMQYQLLEIFKIGYYITFFKDGFSLTEITMNHGVGDDNLVSLRQ